MSHPSLLIALLLTVALTGCGSKYNLHPVTGTVTLDGEPLENATVTFQAAGDGSSASGTTDASGVYSLVDIRPDGGPGAQPGDYIVSVSWTEPPEVDLSQMDSSSPDYDEYVRRAANADPNARPKSSKFPAAYRDGKTSGLTATVTAGNNQLDWQLDTKFKGTP